MSLKDFVSHHCLFAVVQMGFRTVSKFSTIHGRKSQGLKMIENGGHSLCADLTPVQLFKVDFGNVSLPKSKFFVQLRLIVLPCVEIVVSRPPVRHFTVVSFCSGVGTCSFVIHVCIRTV